MWRAPRAGDQVVALDDFTGSFDQCGKNVACRLADAYGLSVTKEQVTRRDEAKGTEAGLAFKCNSVL
ncbi:hypothetical protein A9R05_39395 (plasmid) [Burkholderia sp. KK1]|nr:hypothetical protein A9R05_39395 [Burkholderia sp. KK1]